MFEKYDFCTFNETDVREDVLTPLIQFLGYRKGTKNDIVRELSIRYPHIFIGKKKPEKDPILRGAPDYILKAGKLCWVIEAKSPSVEIDIDAIEQAYSYAAHPEVRAVYFALCNGHKLVVFQTVHGPDSKAVLTLSYEEFHDNGHVLLGLLSPAAIVRQHPVITPDLGIPLGEGLGSIVRIVAGQIQYKTDDPAMVYFNQLPITIAEGSMQRDEAGRVIAYMRTVAPIRSVQGLGSRLGIDKFEMVCEDKAISSDRNHPSIFRYQGTLVFPKGEVGFDMQRWTEGIFLENVSVKVKWEASGVLIGNIFEGNLLNQMIFENHATMEISGAFHMRLD